MAAISKTLGHLVAPVARTLTPRYVAEFIRMMLERAIDGAGPFPGAATSADRVLVESGGDREAAIKKLIGNHVRAAGAQGFVTNIGGLVTAAAAIPANIAGLALVQCHLIAGIAHLRGYNLADPRVRNAVLACMVGQVGVMQLIRSGHITESPRELATDPDPDPETDQVISRVVATELIAQVGGKRVVTFVGRRIPLLGGAFGGSADGFRTWQVGRFAANSLTERHIVVDA